MQMMCTHFIKLSIISCFSKIRSLYRLTVVVGTKHYVMLVIIHYHFDCSYYLQAQVFTIGLWKRQRCQLNNGVCTMQRHGVTVTPVGLLGRFVIPVLKRHDNTGQKLYEAKHTVIEFNQNRHLANSEANCFEQLHKHFRKLYA